MVAGRVNLEWRGSEREEEREAQRKRGRTRGEQRGTGRREERERAADRERAARGRERERIAERQRLRRGEGVLPRKTERTKGKKMNEEQHGSFHKLEPLRPTERKRRRGKRKSGEVVWERESVCTSPR